MSKIILASKSPRRIELLKRLGLEFKVIPAKIDETMGDFPNVSDAIKEVAYKKALAVSNRVAGKYIVIAADTVVIKDNKVLGKPNDEYEAYNMLQFLQGSWHDVITAMAIINCDTLETMVEYEETKVKMSDISSEEIQNYINTKEPMDKAGSYAIQGIGGAFVERIEGCYFNVMGLPLARLNRMLKENNIMIL